jgi:prepilin-type N-terminal cleavage/methylation domain-containing protein/prepilin-type processing-associated H-X9-DG protein
MSLNPNPIQLMKPPQSTCRTRGFTLTEALVVMVIIVVIATFSVMFISRAREGARRAASANNLRQIGVAVTSFISDQAGFLPASRSSQGVYWPQIIWDHCASTDAFLIPQTPKRPMDPAASIPDGYFPMGENAARTPENSPIRWNYTINGGHSRLPFAELASDGQPLPGIGRGLSRPFMQITDPGRTVMIAEGTSWWLNADAKPGSKRIRTWSNGTANILWCDGSVRLLNPKTDLRAEHFWAVK